jgi:hypothetical protein
MRGRRQISGLLRLPIFQGAEALARSATAHLAQTNALGFWLA